MGFSKPLVGTETAHLSLQEVFSLALMQFTDGSFLRPNFLAESAGAMCLVPGGARLNPAEFAFVGMYEVNVGAAGAALNATSVPTDALPAGVPAGTVLDFGAVAQMTVTATATPADDATTLAVSALSRMLPANTYLNFGSGKFAVVAATAAAGATSLSVLAMPAGTKPANTNTATVVATRKVAYVSANAIKSATSLTVAPLEFPLVDADKAQFGGLVRSVAGGKLVGRTYSERDAGTGFGIAVVASDDEIFLTAFAVPDATINPDVTLLRHNTLIYEDRLPDWASYTSEEKAKIRALYQCLKGVS